MLRFLITPRWMGLLVVVIVLGFACVRLSEWQFHRYQERHDSNTLIRSNLSAAPAPVASLLKTGDEPSSALQWRTVTATGHYDAAHQLAVLYRTQGGRPGIDVVTPFVTDAGPAVLVDRGWLPSAGNGNTVLALPPPASGHVTLSGRVRIDATGGSSELAPSQGSVRAISATAIRSSVPYPLYDGFLQLTHESPASPRAPALAGTPDLGSGPSFFYGFQWLFFALLFFGFWCYFAWAEYDASRTSGGAEQTDQSGPPARKSPRKPWRPGADKEDDIVADPWPAAPEGSRPLSAQDRASS